MQFVAVKFQKCTTKKNEIKCLPSVKTACAHAVEFFFRLDCKVVNWCAPECNIVPMAQCLYVNSLRSRDQPHRKT